MANNLIFKENTKIFVYCPAGKVTGGAELLHQLVDLLNRNNLYGGAFIVYYGDKSHEIPSDYKKYNIRVSEKIEDTSDNIIVFYEGIFDFYLDIHNAQIIFWWLSVDNFYICQSDNLAFQDLLRFDFYLFFKALKHRIKLFLLNKKNKSYSLSSICKNNKILCHAYQSEYARDFLEKKGFSNLMPLKDYINDDFFNMAIYPQKKDIVIYNPQKGYKFTKKLIKFGKGINWLPIKGMSREQVKNALLSGKVYIDFGYHPGKDRIPREAAMCGCCIITGKKGSAKYYDDIPINESEYKFAQSNRLIPCIVAKITSLLENYETEINNFSEYRQRISNEKAEFERDALALFRASN